MKDFIYELYQNDNFTLWLTTILVVLVILFVIVFFFGKKDEKLEETKRLQKIDLDAFKKEEEISVKAETPVEEKPQIEKTEEIVPQQTPEIAVNEEVTVTEFKPELEDVEEEIELPKVNIEIKQEKPLFKDHEEEESPISINELPIFAKEDEMLEGELSSLKAIKNEFDNIDIPEVKEEIQEKPIFKPSPQVFSSVYVNKDEEDNVDKTDEEVVTKIEEPKEKENSFVKTFIIEDDDDELELPTLKILDDDKEENKSLLDEVGGEEYEIK